MKHKIVLICIVKNEEHIIRRCLESTSSIIDAICITDTGSTDNTISVIKKFASDNFIPCKVYNDNWKNFGHNRTQSVINTKKYINEVGWDLSITYGLLLDADMKLVVCDNFNKDDITKDKSSIIQESASLSYYNTRIIKLSLDWQCVGVTHEFWRSIQHSTSGKLGKDKLYINDIGDGGAKSDKFERDIKLLLEGIKQEPKNDRYHFYLAQSYKDTGQYEKAIDYYKKRIEMGGWEEEMWYSYYMISYCYKCLGNENAFVDYATQAFMFRPQRSESIYSLVKYYREKSQHKKAYKYYLIGKNVIYPQDDILFIEKDVYNFLYDYEYTILHYYLFPEKRTEGLLSCVNYINNAESKHTCETVFSNLEFYTQRLLDIGEEIRLNIKDYTVDFKPSSIALLLCDDNKILANVRFVNYRITETGSYLMSKDGKLSPNHSVRTENGYIFFDNNFNAVSELKMMSNVLDDITPGPNTPSNILGIEDVRLYMDIYKNICYIGTTAEYSYNETLRIVNGQYDINTCKFVCNKVLRPPIETKCEKNWIPYENKFIYKWSPLTIGQLIDESGIGIIDKLEIKKTIETPSIFNYFRGSSNIILYQSELWCVTHYVKNTSPRKYFHTIVVLDSSSFELKRYSLPFYFDKKGIEYCLGMIINNDSIYMSVSRNDSDPFICKIDPKKLNWIDT